MRFVKTKVCPRCERRKRSKDFSVDRRVKGGLRVYCKICSRKYFREWSENNPGKRRLVLRKWRIKNQRKIREKRRRKYRETPERFLAICRKWGLENPEKRTALYARNDLRLFLRACGVDDLKELRKVSNKVLEAIAKKSGWPDFKEECLEEKRIGDAIRPSQWARAILEYRAGRRYRVAWRFTSTRRRVFKDVFAFYKWQIAALRKIAA